MNLGLAGQSSGKGWWGRAHRQHEGAREERYGGRGVSSRCEARERGQNLKERGLGARRRQLHFVLKVWTAELKAVRQRSPSLQLHMESASQESCILVSASQVSLLPVLPSPVRERTFIPILQPKVQKLAPGPLPQHLRLASKLPPGSVGPSSYHPRGLQPSPAASGQCAGSCLFIHFPRQPSCLMSGHTIEPIFWSPHPHPTNKHRNEEGGSHWLPC